MTKLALPLLSVLVLTLPVRAAEQVLCFPSLMYGHILIGSAASRYETSFVIHSRKGGRVTLKLFSDRNEPLEASFVDDRGNIAETSSAFEFLLAPDRTVKVRLQVPEADRKDEVMVKTGWAMFRFSQESEVQAIIRVRDMSGKLINQYVLLPDTPAQS